MTCSSGKQPYPTKAKAQRALKALAKHGRTVGVPYRCPECEAWHHTRKPAPLGRAGYYPRRPVPIDEAMRRLAEMNEERTR